MKSGRSGLRRWYLFLLLIILYALFSQILTFHIQVEDPMLDYVLMLSNVGPPALTLSAIATMCVHLLIPVMPIASSLHPLYHNFCPTTKFDGLILLRSYRADLDSDADGAVSRIITLSYAVTPLIALPITAVLQFASKIEDGQ